MEGGNGGGGASGMFCGVSNIASNDWVCGETFKVPVMGLARGMCCVLCAGVDGKVTRSR